MHCYVKQLEICSVHRIKSSNASIHQHNLLYGSAVRYKPMQVIRQGKTATILRLWHSTTLKVTPLTARNITIYMLDLHLCICVL